MFTYSLRFLKGFDLAIVKDHLFLAVKCLEMPILSEVIHFLLLIHPVRFAMH